MSKRSRTPSPKSSRLMNSSSTLDLPDNLIVNGKISGDIARNIIQGYDLKHCNRISINSKLFFVNNDNDLQETELAMSKTKKKKKRIKKTRRKKGKKLKRK
tara:strand:- start:6384 stop:6686 length:303 start_codon:yes stop_codon:yes gene_type:complete